MRFLIGLLMLTAFAAPALACDGKDSNFASCDGRTILDVQAPSGDAGAPTGDGNGDGDGGSK